ncbi:uncharacterized protein ACA1_040780 [Acanthamoeba castellanii str. Neff]|uniref:Uncharacterized protein n=1 Tax=Acanthamoeba castellanii (strain ATCC 30010 / Neff) TaxID=1257118 RepID=L8H0L9_ACACF|nr:uncharacterized protein ACA1_040780 [Acanthamoeba castellanii str. Neff]ELR18762.1 hypothetical protein ACA1_040780 [Acanthamoeba castellanii str. Neff]
MTTDKPRILLNIDKLPANVWRPREYRVISDRQVGADEGALRGAIAAALPSSTAGYMPKGFKRVGGPDPKFATKYNLCETANGQGSDADRDRQNVDNSDLLVAFLVDKPMTGRHALYDEKGLAPAIPSLDRFLDVL